MARMERRQVQAMVDAGAAVVRMGGWEMMTESLARWGLPRTSPPRKSEGDGTSIPPVISPSRKEGALYGNRTTGDAVTH